METKDFFSADHEAVFLFKKRILVKANESKLKYHIQARLTILPPK